MLLTFQADEIRLQVAHAAAAHEHAAIGGRVARPALHLVRRGRAIHLASNGVPAHAAVAYAAGFDPRRPEAASPLAPGELEDLGTGDFVEVITLESFTKTLASRATQVRVVVRSTYINVLGGQPERPPGYMPHRASR